MPSKMETDMRLEREQRAQTCTRHGVCAIDHNPCNGYPRVNGMNAWALVGENHGQSYEDTHTPSGNRCKPFARESIAAQCQQDKEQEANLTWAVERWNREVKNRPLRNVHRRALDDTWRQVIRHFGGDPEVLCGPSHDALMDTRVLPPSTRFDPLGIFKAVEAVQDLEDHAAYTAAEHVCRCSRSMKVVDAALFAVRQLR